MGWQIQFEMQAEKELSALDNSVKTLRNSRDAMIPVSLANL
jgi:hypothetical protein